MRIRVCSNWQQEQSKLVHVITIELLNDRMHGEWKTGSRNLCKRFYFKIFQPSALFVIV